PPTPDDPPAAEQVELNEYGGKLFSHTSPVYVRMAGQGVFNASTARGLIEEMRSSLASIERQAVFHSDAQRRQVASLYDEAIGVLQRRIAVHGRPPPQPP